jgi:hypothetical protein
MERPCLHFPLEFLLIRRVDTGLFGLKVWLSSSRATNSLPRKKKNRSSMAIHISCLGCKVK